MKSINKLSNIAKLYCIYAALTATLLTYWASISLSITCDSHLYSWRVHGQSEKIRALQECLHTAVSTFYCIWSTEYRIHHINLFPYEKSVI